MQGLRWKTAAATGLVVFGGGAAALAATNGTTAPRTTAVVGTHAHAMHRGPLQLDTAATYLGISTTDLLTQLQAGKTLAQIANATSGRSARQLAVLLVVAASKRLQTISDRPMSGAQQQALANLIRPRITGFLNDTCPLALGALGKHLAGCPGMSG
jgi:hypothetical protein